MTSTDNKTSWTHLQWDRVADLSNTVDWSKIQVSKYLLRVEENTRKLRNSVSREIYRSYYLVRSKSMCEINSLTAASWGNGFIYPGSRDCRFHSDGWYCYLVNQWSRGKCQVCDLDDWMKGIMMGEARMMLKCFHVCFHHPTRAIDHLWHTGVASPYGYENHHLWGNSKYLK